MGNDGNGEMDGKRIGKEMGKDGKWGENLGWQPFLVQTSFGS